MKLFQGCRAIIINQWHELHCRVSAALIPWVHVHHCSSPARSCWMPLTAPRAHLKAALLYIERLILKLHWGKKKKAQITFTKTYSGSNSLISTYIQIYLKLKFPAVISETTALWECKRQTVKLIWVFPSCFLRFGWHPILPSPCCLLSHFSLSNCSCYFYLSNNSLMCFFWFFECASFDFLALNQILGPIFAFWPGKLVLFPLKWTKKRNKNKWYKLIVLAPQWNHKL